MELRFLVLRLLPIPIKQILKLSPVIEKRISDLQLDLLTCFERAIKQKNRSHIKINKKAFPGTFFKSVFSSLVLETELNNFIVFEKQKSPTDFELVCQKNPRG